MLFLPDRLIEDDEESSLILGDHAVFEIVVERDRRIERMSALHERALVFELVLTKRPPWFRFDVGTLEIGADQRIVDDRVPFGHRRGHEIVKQAEELMHLMAQEGELPFDEEGMEGLHESEHRRHLRHERLSSRPS
ncbi:MAG: hypothetical protein MZU95_08050 [Desulfomicrobium escambiense]|nr:hypothetical protein [Desulfomicrobium escambiense]